MAAISAVFLLLTDHSLAQSGCSGPTLTLIGQTDVLCSGQSNGSATMSATGGSGFTYTWSPAGGNAATASGLNAGTYTLSATNSTCADVAIMTVTINEPSALVTGTAITNALCNGGTGSATISVSGGTLPYSYLWSGGGTNSVISNPAGVYNATVTDANGCSSSKAVNITQPPVLVAGSSVKNPVCPQANGSATITASGGTGPFSYLWSNFATSSVISVPSGVYSGTVSDANGCPGTISVTIVEPSPVVTNTLTTNVLCNGGTGSASITASGGTGSYTYSWSTGATTSVIANLAGTYTVSVTDANNCSNTRHITITQPSALLLSTAVTSVLCNGGNGSATVSATGGTGAYAYLWSTAATASVITNLAGVYTATVTDANGCNISNTVTLAQPQVLVASLTTKSISCNGANGSATISATGGSGSYLYFWSNAATTSIVAVPAGAYTVAVMDANGCSKTSTVTFTQPPALTLTATASSPSVCPGGSTHVAFNSGGSGGTGTISYSWTNGPTSSFWGAYPAVNSTYTINIFDANNCTTSKTLSVTIGPSPTITATSGSICAGDFFNIVASGGISYGGQGPKSPSVTTTYTVMGTGANFCPGYAVVTITVFPLPVYYLNNSTICSGQSATFTPQVPGNYSPNGPGTYTFTGPNNYTFTGSSAIVSPTVTSAYTLTATSYEGCLMNGYTMGNVYVNSTNVTVNSGSICAGESFTLSPSGASSYTYSGGSNVVSPVNTTTYTVIGKGSNGCVSSAQISTVTVIGPVMVSITGKDVICTGETTTLTANGASTYSWSGNVTTSSITVSPSINTSYTAFGYIGKCTNSAVITLTVNATPTINISGVNGFCAGETITLTAGGGNTYLWSNGLATNSIVISPATFTNYTVIGTNSNNCSSVAAHSVNVYPIPTINANGGTICTGSSFTINPSGASTYSYSGGTGVVSPTASASYSITGKSSDGCAASNTAVISVVVNPLPVISVLSSNSLICEGETATITVHGADSYTWSTGSNDAAIVVSPIQQTNYSVAGKDGNTCVGLANIVQGVSECTGIGGLVSSANETVQLYPNPNNGLFIVESDLTGELLIINALGELIYKTTLEAGKQNIDLQTLPKGFYFVRVSVQGYSKVTRVIKE